MAWRDDCTKHKPKTGGMSTKFGEAKKSSLPPTKRSRINPKRPGPQEARDKDSSDIGRFGGGDTEEDTGIFTEEDAKPQRNFRPFDVNRTV